MDRRTVDVYEAEADRWAAKRSAGRSEPLERFLARIPAGARALDLGCGPGWHTAPLGPGTVASDAAAAMLRLVPDHAPDALRVQADLEALPFARGSLGAAWAQKTHHHVPAERLPLALWDLHRCLAVGAPVDLLVLRPVPDDDADDFPGRLFAHWEPGPLRDVVEGAGFTIDALEVEGDWVRVQATRARTLADTVGPGMRLLVVGLNPSEYAADRGVGFARPGNRFWPAARAAGIVTRDRDPRDALVSHGVGMTDLVKRATPRADGLAAAEYRAGAARVERLVRWLEPAAVCFVGLSGYRAAIDRGARTGWQDARFGGRPAYVMPNPSGANAHARPDGLVQHLRDAAARAESSRA